jgi:type I restriction enzyme S subunit
LGECGAFLGGGTPSKSNDAFWKGSIPWVSPKDMKRAYIGDAEDHISEEAVEQSAVKLVPSRSLLFVVRGMILAHSFPVALTTREVTVNQDMKALVFTDSNIDEFVLRVCWASRARVLAKVERSSHGTCRLDFEVVAQLPIPIAPLAEQKRIVTKVDALTKLCSDLEAKLKEKDETISKFAEAIASELVA